MKTILDKKDAQGEALMLITTSWLSMHKQLQKDSTENYRNNSDRSSKDCKKVKDHLLDIVDQMSKHEVNQILQDETALSISVEKIHTTNKGMKDRQSTYKNKSTHYDRLHSLCKTQSEKFNFQPNNNQFACAAYIHNTLRVRERVLLTMPPGKGKSRIILSLLLVYQSHPNQKYWDRFVIVFTHQELLNADRDMYEQMAQTWGIEIKLLVFNVEILQNEINSQDFVIYDEADFVFLDKLFDPPECKFLVGLTATPSLKQYEIDLYDAHKMAVVHSGVRANIEINDVEKTTINAFIASSQNATMMFFLDEDRIEEIQQKCRGRSEFLTNEAKRTKLRALSENTVVFVTDELLMRGLDYRSQARDGIHLIFMKPFSSSRALI